MSKEGMNLWFAFGKMMKLFSMDKSKQYFKTDNQISICACGAWKVGEVSYL